MISVILPVYHCSERLYEYVSELQILIKSLNHQLECILVDDSAVEKLNDTLLRLAEMKCVSVYRNPCNMGQQGATAKGMARAKGDVIITLDDDGKHDLALIPKMLLELSRGYDIVFGIEREKLNKPIRSFFSLRVSALINRAFPMRRYYYVSSFRCFKRKLLDLSDYQKDFYYISCELLKRASSVANVIYKPDYSGDTRYSVWRRLVLFANIVKEYGW